MASIANRETSTIKAIINNSKSIILFGTLALLILNTLTKSLPDTIALEISLTAQSVWKQLNLAAAAHRDLDENI